MDRVAPSLWKFPKLGMVFWMIVVSALLLFVASSVRHILFQSGAFDLGYFDQAIYLISQGETPVVSFWGFHFLGGHADWMVYPLALLYKLYPSVYWLFAVQAIALALGALPTYHLAQQAGLNQTQAKTFAAVYLLYPLVFNLNLFDFHPEVMALPLILAAVWAARQNKIIAFTVCTILILGCRDALSLTIAAMGFWLLVFEQRRVCGAIALITGIAWFLIATQLLIPAFRPAGVEATLRYAYLGDSVLEIARNLLLKPHLILGRIFSLATLEYLLLLSAPLLWSLQPFSFALTTPHTPHPTPKLPRQWLTELKTAASPRYLTPLVAALPMLAMNILSDAPSQRDLVHQYSLPVLPFLMLAAIAAFSAQKTWLKNQRLILLWSLVAFLALAKYGYFGSLYLRSLDNWSATQTAITQVPSRGSVLTTHEIVPHLTHRAQIRFTLANDPPDLATFDYVLLNTRHPGWMSTPEFATSLVNQLQRNARFQLRYQRDDVYLFVQKQK